MSRNQNTTKSTSTWLNVWTSWATNKNLKTNLLFYRARQLDENKQSEFLRSWYKQIIAYAVYVIFGINASRNKLSQVSLVVFMPNITRNHAITYTNS